MIEVRLFAYLPDVSRSRQRRMQVPYSEGLRVRDLLEMEGIAGEDLAIMVNQSPSSTETLLRDGDSVFFLPAIAGGDVKPGNVWSH